MTVEPNHKFQGWRRVRVRCACGAYMFDKGDVWLCPWGHVYQKPVFDGDEHR